MGPTGAIDNGAVANGTTERSLVVEWMTQLHGSLKADPALEAIQLFKIGIDERLTLADHIRTVNDICRRNNWTKSDALLLSLHINVVTDADMRGLEAWYSATDAPLDGARVAVGQVAAATGLPPKARPTLVMEENRWARLGIIDDTMPDACLLEVNFLRHEFDPAFLKEHGMESGIVQSLHRTLRLMMGLPPDPMSASGSSFADVPADAPYRDDLRLCMEAGFFAMPPDGLFHPERMVTKSELAVLLAKHLRSHHDRS